MQETRGCPSCDRDVPEGAVWCGACGHRLIPLEEPELDRDVRALLAEASEDEPGTRPHRAPPSLGIAPLSAASAAAPGLDDVPEPIGMVPDPAEEARPRRTAAQRVATMHQHAVALLTITSLFLGVTGLAAISARVNDPGLLDAIIAGDGDADGRDSARTGRIEAQLPQEPAKVVWSKTAQAEHEYPSYAILASDIVVLSKGFDADILDRVTGTRLWRSEGFVQGLTDRGVLVQDSNARITLRDRRDGSVIWEATAFGHSLLANDEVIMISASGTTTIEVLDPDTGVEVQRFETIGNANVLAVTDEHLVVQGTDFTPGEGGSQARVIERSTGETVYEIELQEYFDPSRLIPVGDGRLIVFDDGQREARLLDLATGEVLERLEQFDSAYLEAQGDYLASMGPFGVRMYDRSTLELLWENRVAQGLSLYPRNFDPDALAITYTGNTTTYVEPETGAEVASFDFDDFGFTHADRKGIIRTTPGTVTYSTLDGEEVWVNGEVDVTGRVSLRVVDGRVLTAIGGDFIAHDLTGAITRPLRISLADAASGPLRPGVVASAGMTLVANGQGLRAYASPRAFGSDEWSVALGGAATAVVIAGEEAVVATDEIIRRIDLDTGEVLAQRGLVGIRSITVAGEEGIFAIATSDGCELAEGCESVVHRLVPEELTVEWTSPAIADVCGAATVGRNHLALPTGIGVAFVSARSGRMTGTWDDLPGTCVGLAHDGVNHLAPHPDGLAVGRPGGTPMVIDLEAAVTTAPVIVDGHALVGLAGGTLALVDLGERTTSWRFDVGEEIVAVPQLGSRTIFVALASGRVARIG